MNISMIGCPFQTAFGSYIESLMNAIGKLPEKHQVRWIASNCGCNIPVELGKQFQAPGCEYFDMRNLCYYGPSNPLLRWLRVRVNDASCAVRAGRYAELSRGSDVVHFQQVLNAYGSSVAFQWLRRPSKEAKVVTIHEFDEHQRLFPERNANYNRAQALIVHCRQMKDELMEMGIPKGKVHVVLNGADIPSQNGHDPRDGIVFHCGHDAMAGKGLPAVFKAMAILKNRLGAAAPRLKVHGHYPAEPPREAREIIEELGVGDCVTWMNQLPMSEMGPLYRRSLMLLLPYSRSFAGEPAAIAAANGLPVICTRKAGIPDHLASWGVWVEENNPEQLADRIVELLENEQLREDLAVGLRKRAEEALSWNLIARQTVDIYRAAIAAN